VRSDPILGSQARAGCESYLRGLDYTKVNDLKEAMEFNEVNHDMEFDEGECPSYGDSLQFLTQASLLSESERLEKGVGDEHVGAGEGEEFGDLQAMGCN
jgi:hypothetical protein